MEKRSSGYANFLRNGRIKEYSVHESEFDAWKEEQIAKDKKALKIFALIVAGFLVLAIGIVVAPIILMFGLLAIAAAILLRLLYVVIRDEV
jgi:Flp pilus assembly protein TadB